MAISKASENIIEKGKHIAAHILETADADIDYEEANFRVAGTDRMVSLFDVARASKDPSNLPDGADTGLDESYSHLPDAATYPNGCHVCEVEIDPSVGNVEIVNLTAVDDLGKIINPMIIDPTCLLIKWKLSLYSFKPLTEEADKFNNIPTVTRNDIEITLIFLKTVLLNLSIFIL